MAVLCTFHSNNKQKCEIINRNPDIVFKMNTTLPSTLLAWHNGRVAWHTTLQRYCGSRGNVFQGIQSSGHDDTTNKSQAKHFTLKKWKTTRLRRHLLNLCISYNICIMPTQFSFQDVLSLELPANIISILHHAIKLVQPCLFCKHHCALAWYIREPSIQDTVSLAIIATWKSLAFDQHGEPYTRKACQQSVYL